jgi:hypothetical protein
MDKPEVEIRYEYNKKDGCFHLSAKDPIWPSDVPCQFDAAVHGNVSISKRYIPLPVALAVHNLDAKQTMKMSVSGDPFNPFEGEPSSIEVSPLQIYPLYVKLNWGIGYGAAVAVEIEPEGCSGGAENLRSHTTIHIEC